MRRRLPALALLAASAALAFHFACRAQDDAGAAPTRPNVLWIVWDTVRADRMSLYGHERPTTPKLDAWARGARVFEDVVSAAPTTTPSHASMFTGLLPVQHGTTDKNRWLADHHVTIAELLGQAGYGTYLWSSNPHVSREENFQQGFDHEAHPWDPAYRARATKIVREKMRGDRTSEIAQAKGDGGLAPWSIKAAGELAEVDLLEWLAGRETGAPYFAVLNYMEAHRPFIPPRSARAKVMAPGMVDRSYRVDRSWIPMWTFTFGLFDYPEAQLELMARTYDATLIELDDLFAHLLASLDAGGYLENTAIVLTADHGEHLGEHHMLDHQYSLYAPVLHVPLVVHYPPRIPPGRSARPVMNFDLFPTVLDLAGVEAPPELVTKSRSLLDPSPERARVAEYPAVYERPFRAMRRRHPDWDPARFSSRMRAYYEDSYKLIRGEDGRHELYDVANDPWETRDLAGQRAEQVERLAASLEAYVASLGAAARPASERPALSPEHREMLKGLGYLLEEGDEDEPEEAGAEQP